MPHPRQVLLPASLAGIEPDPITAEVPDVLKRMHLDGVISDAQFDAVVLMLNAFENNHGFVLADDVGLGKTREIGAYLYSLFSEGKINRALLTTFSGTNVADMISE
jgi:SNF2 family DNA or RNA helicase